MTLVVSRQIIAADGFTIGESAQAFVPDDLLLDSSDRHDRIVEIGLITEALFSALPQLSKP